MLSSVCVNAVPIAAVRPMPGATLLLGTSKVRGLLHVPGAGLQGCLPGFKQLAGISLLCTSFLHFLMIASSRL